MKTYKVKSLIYLSCFVIAAVFYYNFEQHEIFQSSILASQTAEMEAEDAPKDDNTEETKKDQE